VHDSLGEPDDTVPRRDPTGTPPVKRSLREIFAIVLLLSGFPPVLGWIAGLVLLLSSPLWTGRQKLLGALVWPGGYSVFLMGAPMTATVAGVSSPKAVRPSRHRSRRPDRSRRP